jgi:hypothetical protein
LNLKYFFLRIWFTLSSLLWLDELLIILLLFLNKNEDSFPKLIILLLDNDKNLVIFLFIESEINDFFFDSIFELKIKEKMIMI